MTLGTTQPLKQHHIPGDMNHMILICWLKICRCRRHLEESHYYHCYCYQCLQSTSSI